MCNMGLVNAYLIGELWGRLEELAFKYLAHTRSSAIFCPLPFTQLGCTWNVSSR